MLKIGSHVSMANGLLGAAQEAFSYGANTFMIYTGAPQNTRRSPLEKLKIPQGQKFMSEHNISDIVVHAPYIINMASFKEDTYNLACKFLETELQRTKALGSQYLVLHPGAFTKSTLEQGIENIVNGLNKILSPDLPTVCLETMAGKGTEIGRNFEELSQIINGIDFKDKIGVCFDTCHLHDSGYDIVNNFDNLLEEFDSKIGFEYLKTLHINGSINERGAKKDRHANIGADESNPRGKDLIGKKALYKIVHNDVFKDKPLILETPWLDDKSNLYKEEIAFLRS
ncbi:deoxyribonuclease IV [Candidatus Epulonipiscium fishelsonii]|uniref:Deoxyribonuclease IV n=1 Tax=Candidatus Epulonipiscium fishelsonii TaxID=77094 RepID=A0ACC8X988_9FIRM|nr:deoxyribonuclease IV [Epulopiscium sp. SCG-B11WGA-EpuloA1]ONI43151.1 deoxyribonuclease IV [Epulopiscium sp. SCG-B05WGA-EpuloA1]